MWTTFWKSAKHLSLAMHPAMLRRGCAQSGCIAWQTVLASHLSGGLARLDHNIPAEHILDAGWSRQDEKKEENQSLALEGAGLARINVLPQFPHHPDANTRSFTAQKNE